MLEKDNLTIIKKQVAEFFEKMSYEVEIKSSSDGDTVMIDLELEKPQILIGEGGQTLAAIQHLIKAILKRKIKEPFYIDIDINNYKVKKNKYLKETANFVADDVFSTKIERKLNPMSAYERRIVHMELADREDVITESIGYGLDRRVIIKPR